MLLSFSGLQRIRIGRNCRHYPQLPALFKQYPKVPTVFCLLSPLIPGHVFVQGKNIASRARHIVPQMGRLPSWHHNRLYHGPAKEGR
jgi:hypothetical protein